MFIPFSSPKNWLLTVADHIVVVKDEGYSNRLLSEDIIRTISEYAMQRLWFPSYASGGAKAR